MKIRIESLTKDGLQLREAICEDVVAEYADAMRGGAVFPPVTAFFDGNRTYLADGFHRVEAAQRAGLREIDADVRNGDYYAAEAFACGANSVTPRTYETKKRCVLRLWEHRKEHFGKYDPSDRDIANLSKMPRTTVKRIISELANVGQLVLPNTVTGKDGVTRPRTLPTWRQHAEYLPPPSRDTTVEVHPVPQRTRDGEIVKAGYHIDETDGRIHADGVILDQFGTEVPGRIEDAFTSSTLGELISDVLRIKTRLTQAKENNDIALAAVTQRAIIELDNAYHELKAARPYCVCRMCSGNGCRSCGKLGFQTEDKFKRNPPEANP